MIDHKDLMEEFEGWLFDRGKVLKKNEKWHPDSLMIEGQSLEIRIVRKQWLRIKARLSRPVPYPRFCSMPARCEGKNSCQRDPNCCE